LSYYIFQGNPDIFDINTYIADNYEIQWQVRQHIKDVHVGDVVFIWRASGKKKAVSGIVALAEVLTEPDMLKDEFSSQQLWLDDENHSEARRVKLKILKKCIASKEVVKRDWLLDDPILKEIKILKSASGTNFQISTQQGQRLNDLCINTGRDWKYEECVAGLWAFKETLGKEVSKLPNSPVSNVALNIGRAVSGVYNKVMNFRSIDPSDDRKGFSSTNHIDHQVWNDFFDSGTNSLDSTSLDNAYNDYWINGNTHSTIFSDKDGSPETTAYSWIIKDSKNSMKNLDKSAFLHRGTGIPVDIRSFFKADTMKSGDRIPISLQYGTESFEAHIEMDSQDTPRTRLFWSSDFSKELRNLFPYHYKQFSDGNKNSISQLLMKFEVQNGLHQYLISFSGDIQQETIEQDIQSEIDEDTGSHAKEGAVREYFGKRYERDPANRKKAIKIHGLECRVCNFNFEEMYGERGADFIEIHHRKPIYTFEGQAQTIDPHLDLVPLCSNCHRMIHRRSDNVLTVEQLQEIMKNNTQTKNQE